MHDLLVKLKKLYLKVGKFKMYFYPLSSAEWEQKIYSGYHDQSDMNPADDL